jgi:uncharacterized protein
VAYSFDWDELKAISNVDEHRVSFEEAATAFTDPFGCILADPDHSSEEERFIFIGFSVTNRLLVISYTEDDTILRLISARPATKREVMMYAKNQS